MCERAERKADVFVGEDDLCVAVLEKETVSFKRITVWVRPHSVLPELI